MPIPALIVPESIVMVPIPIARPFAIVVIEPVVIVVIPIGVLVTVLIVVIPIVPILRVSQSYAKKKTDHQCCSGSKPASTLHENLL